MRYQGWNFEKTLLIQSDSPLDRHNEFIDVAVTVETKCAATLARDVRVVLKPAWNRFGNEVPCQVYDIQEHGSVTVFRVAFIADIPAHATQRVGILYDNPDAKIPKYETDLVMSDQGKGRTLENAHYRARLDPQSGNLDSLSIKLKVLEYTHLKTLTPTDNPQGAVRVIFADPENPESPSTASAANWQQPETRCVEGPLFISITRKGRLAPQGQTATDRHPSLELAYRFVADQPVILVSSRLAFHQDTLVYGIHNDWLAVKNDCFSHYCFRPDSPSLPATDVEEAGHILVDAKHIQSLPPGPIFGGFLPYNMPWHAFISTVRTQAFRFDYALTSIRLHESSETSGAPDGKAPQYRAATYLCHDRDQLSWFRAPVYVKKQNRIENMITIPKGSVYAETYALHLGEWDEKKNWLLQIEALGKRLNQPLTITQHPRLLDDTIIPEENSGLFGSPNFGFAYKKAGIR